MKIRLIAVGKPRDRQLAESIAEYEKRAARYWPLAAHDVREENTRSADVARAREGDRLLERAQGAVIVACDERGDAMTSVEFADWLQAQREAARDIAFVLGGAHGLDARLRSGALRILSLAPWTLPHEVARLVLAEQLYRAGTIVRREPYHKA
ncbi:MAG: 23S rRNA (pseudouridine(1915)-N(3))-methyltransferase RlmH [Gemmatimonadaceae bacterium]